MKDTGRRLSGISRAHRRPVHHGLCQECAQKFLREPGWDPKRAEPGAELPG